MELENKAEVLLELGFEKKKIIDSFEDKSEVKFSELVELVKVPKTAKKEFNKSKMFQLSRQIRELVNQRILYIHFENSTIIIHPKTVFIRIHDILAENVEDADIRAFNQALKHIVKLNKIGLYEETISLEDGHFARIESVLAEFLQKIDKKYKLDLGNGKKFWIDNSNNNLEDETDDPVARKRIDNNLTEMAHNDINLTDIEKMKSLVGDLIKLETIKATQPIEQINKKEDIKPIEKLDYVG